MEHVECGRARLDSVRLGQNPGIWISEASLAIALEKAPRQLRAKASDHNPELLVRSCLMPCKKKKVQEGVMAIFTYVSKVGSRPWLPQVPIQFHQQRLGHGLIISCPGARPEHAVAWDKDHQYLYRTQYLKGVNGSMRVFIDHGNHLHIRFTQLEDRGIYYCWRQGERIAGFRLGVTSPGRYPVSFSDPETQAALGLILIGYMLITVIFISAGVSGGAGPPLPRSVVSDSL